MRMRERMGLVNGLDVEQSRVRQEARRLRAWELVQEGWKHADVARTLGVTRGAVSQWVRRAREGGAEALRRSKPPGGRPKLTGAQLALLPDLLERGPSAFGFCGEGWTRRRAAWVMEREFGATYDPSQVGRILKGCGFRPEPQARRAGQRDEEVIRQWREGRLGDLKRGP